MDIQAKILKFIDSGLTAEQIIEKLKDEGFTKKDAILTVRRVVAHKFNI